MNLKQIAGEKAVEYVEDGMIVGLGTGSTAYFAIRKIAEKVREGMKITGVCTSIATRELAEQWDIPVADVDEADHIDLTIDGADEVDPQGNGIKGGGGALLFEKIVASVSDQNIWVVEERKRVRQLGTFPLPVEILPFGHTLVHRIFSEKGYRPEWRKKGDKMFTTDGKHYLADLHLGVIEDPFRLDADLKNIPGVVEHGLFLNTVNKVICAGVKGTEVITFR